ncbi:hypothetical protein [Acidovorax sp. NCPPB 4044]|uniref:hypothetical protein n=1 Tax=Acidovorax sp. NCPPB 4044 TaxID=2940490 RepID=UPI00230458C9|nr:hypothetical protein [Acidovorax sp. NCPPB 4044]MDA8522315.1 hypothetical protein [Acidovorax sp. NCPPB 4044]
MKIAKPFLRDGVVLQPGDPLPTGLDDETVKHYLRHGMVARSHDQTATPAPHQSGRSARTPSQPAGTRAPKPTSAQQAAPAPAQQAGPTSTQLAGPSIAVTLTPTTTKDAQTDIAGSEAGDSSDPGAKAAGDKPADGEGRPDPQTNGTDLNP